MVNCKRKILFCSLHPLGNYFAVYVLLFRKPLKCNIQRAFCGVSGICGLLTTYCQCYNFAFAEWGWKRRRGSKWDCPFTLLITLLTSGDVLSLILIVLPISIIGLIFSCYWIGKRTKGALKQYIPYSTRVSVKSILFIIMFCYSSLWYTLCMWEPHIEFTM